MDGLFSLLPFFSFFDVIFDLRTLQVLRRVPAVQTHARSPYQGLQIALRYPGNRGASAGVRGFPASGPRSSTLQP